MARDGQPKAGTVSMTLVIPFHHIPHTSHYYSYLVDQWATTTTYNPTAHSHTSHSCFTRDRSDCPSVITRTLVVSFLYESTRHYSLTSTPYVLRTHSSLVLSPQPARALYGSRRRPVPAATQHSHAH